MRIQIHGWESKGIAGIDMDVDLADGKSKPSKVAMIWLDSGGGKTTTHNLIKACLTNDLSDIENNWSKYARKSEDPYYKEQGLFKLKVSFDKVIYIFTIKLNFISQIIEFETEGGPSGHSFSYKPPHAAKPYLKKEFVDLYIFNGEKAEEMVEPKSDSAKTTFETIYQLNYFDTISESLDIYFKKLKESSSHSVSDKSQVTLINNKIDKLKERRKILNDEMSKWNKKIISADGEIKKLILEGEKVNKDAENKRIEISEHEQKESELLADIDIQCKKILNLYMNPYKISNEIAKEFIVFKENLERLKIPEHSAKEFFLDLVQTEKCICDEPMTESRKKIILDNAKKYVGSNFTGFLNAMKNDVGLHVEGELKNNTNIFELLHADLSLKKADLLTVQRILEGLRDEVKTHSGRSLKEIEDDKNVQFAIKAQGEIFIENFSKMDHGIDEKTPVHTINSKPSIDALIKQFEAKLNVTKTLREKAETIESIKILLSKCRKDTAEALKVELINKMNMRLRDIVKDDNIQVVGIDNSIQHTGASTGQALVVSYVFLSTALEMAIEANEFPLLVDSPAAPIGPRYRKNTAKLIAKLPNQYIALLQGGERQWFCKTLYDNSQPDISVITLFKKEPYYKKYLDNPPKTLIHQENSAMVHGYDFLMEFEGEDSGEDLEGIKKELRGENV